MSTPLFLLSLILLNHIHKNAVFRSNILNYLNMIFTFGKRPEDNFINRTVQYRPAYSLIHSFSHPLFLWGGSRTGPVLSLFDRFRQIGPRASRGPAPVAAELRFEKYTGHNLNRALFCLHHCAILFISRWILAETGYI